MEYTFKLDEHEAILLLAALGARASSYERLGLHNVASVYVNIYKDLVRQRDALNRRRVAAEPTGPAALSRKLTRKMGGYNEL